jgi:hypothetical protein
VALLQKSAYGTKQGARRFYDFTIQVFKQIGLQTCPTDPCLFRYLYEDLVCFLLQYVDDVLISGELQAITQIQKEMKRYMQCKFDKPKNFLGLALLTYTRARLPYPWRSPSRPKLNMSSTSKTPIFGEVLTPGRTDKKINRTDEHEPNDNYRSYVGTLNWFIR